MLYPTQSYIVIEFVVPFMDFLVQLEPFDYSIVNVNQQAIVYDFLFGSSSFRDIPAPSINHDCTIKIDGVVKISVNKVNEINLIKVDQFMEKFSIKIYKQDKGLDILFKKVTILVPLRGTPKLYAIFLCNLMLR